MIGDATNRDSLILKVPIPLSTTPLLGKVKVDWVPAPELLPISRLKPISIPSQNSKLNTAGRVRRLSQVLEHIIPPWGTQAPISTNRWKRLRREPGNAVQLQTLSANATVLYGLVLPRGPTTKPRSRLGKKWDSSSTSLSNKLASLCVTLKNSGLILFQESPSNAGAKMSHHTSQISALMMAMTACVVVTSSTARNSARRPRSRTPSPAWLILLSPLLPSQRAQTASRAHNKLLVELIHSQRVRRCASATKKRNSSTPVKSLHFRSSGPLSSPRDSSKVSSKEPRLSRRT